MISIPETNLKRVVIVGGGFAGLTLAQKIDSRYYQIVLIDRNNYHQFPPLIYQVASSGLEAGSICFPLRRLVGNKKNLHFRVAAAQKIDPENKILETTLGSIRYDCLIICAGTKTNFYGNANVEKFGLPMKTVEDAMYLRNRIIENMEAYIGATEEEKEARSNIVIVGGGATGVEISGVLAELKKYAIKKKYTELENIEMNIHLVSHDILGAMSSHASSYARKTLTKMGVNIVDALVQDYDGDQATLSNGSTIKTKTLIWVSGIIAPTFEGIPSDCIGRGGRIKCDRQMKVEGLDGVYAAGDIALTSEDAFPNGHPQLAQVALQEGWRIAKNLNAAAKNKKTKDFKYKNLGSMATVGRNKAAADLGRLKFGGFIAWLIWIGIHLLSIIGLRNRFHVLFDWMINYFHYAGSLRMMIFKGKR